MLFNKKNDMITGLEAEIKSLRQRLHDAEMVIADQKAKIDELSRSATRERSKPKKEQHNTAQTPSTRYANSDKSIDEIAQLLYDYVCADKAARLDQHVNPKTIFDIRAKHKARPDLNVDLLKIISGSGVKVALISQWKRKKLNSEAKPCFAEVLPTFFNMLNKHWWIAGQGTDKSDLWKYSNLKYNANAYALLYKEIIPQLVVDAENSKKEQEQEKLNKPVIKGQKVITSTQNRENKKYEHEVKVSEVAVSAKQLLDQFGEKFLVECWIELGGATLDPPSASKYIKTIKKKLSKSDGYDSEKLKDVKTFMYLTEEILPPLALSYQQVKEKERLKLTHERREKQQKDIEAAIRADWPQFKADLEIRLEQHAVAFMRNIRAAYQKDDYGAVFKDEREVEVERFLRSVNLIQRAKKHGIKKTVQHINRWYAKKKRELEQAEAAPENGHDFEHWVAAQLNNAGWTATVTQASGDDGVDVIAERDGVSVAVQCKRFKGSVGNKAVQEVYSGMKHMQLDRAVVISTGQYTKAAKGLASTTGVLLLSEHDIPHMWDLLQK